MSQGVQNTQFDKIKVVDFPVFDSGAALERFARAPFTYKQRPLMGKCSPGKDGGIDVVPSLDIGDGEAIQLCPGLCSSFAVWPPKVKKSDDLMKVCPDDMLRPQFVFLALNWSSRIAPNDLHGESARSCLERIPRWGTFHRLHPRDENYPYKPEEHERAFTKDNPFRGAYITDFVKGYVDSKSEKVRDFLESGEVSGCNDNPFTVFLEILRNELDSLDKAFELGNVKKYLIVFGPKIYNDLQKCAKRIQGKSLDELFPDRTVLRTGCFINRPFGKTSQQCIEGLRTLYFPDGEVRTVEEFAADFV